MFKYYFYPALFLLFYLSDGHSQLATPPDSLFINRVDFSGVQFFDEGFLHGEIQTRQNYWLFNKSIKPGLALYRTFDFIIPDFSFLDYLKNYLMNNFGEAPYYFNAINLSDDLSYLNQYYRYNGFFHSRIDTTISWKPGGVQIRYEFHEGEQGFLNSIRYEIEGREPVKIAKEIYESPIIREGEGYSVFKIRDERLRILNITHDNGFSFTNEDSITVIADTTAFPAIDLTFLIRPSEKTMTGLQNITIYTNRLDSGEPLKDTVTVRKVNVVTTSFRELDPEIVARHIKLKSGELFTPKQRNETVRSLNELGVFNSVNVGIDSVNYDPAQNIYRVNTGYNLVMAPKHEIRPEIRIDTKSDGSFGSDLIYSNKNIFNAAENLRISGGGSVQIPASITGSKSQYSEWSLSGGIDLNFPYFFGTTNRSQVGFKWQQAQRVARQPGTTASQPYDLTIITAGFRFQLRHGEFTRSYIDIPEINWVKADQYYFTSQGNTRVTDPYLNSVLRWTIQWLNTDIIEKNYGGSQEFTIEESGLLPRMLSASVDKSEVQTSTDGQTGKIFGLDYYQYTKLATDLRWYVPITRDDTYAMRLTAGYIFPYGVSRDTPDINRFFGGGVTSLRGWAPTFLGPGDYNRTNDSSLTGYYDIKLEGSFEYRKKWNPDWGYALFLDWGNLWNREGKPGAFTFSTFYKQLAVNYGFGLRYYLPIGPVRIDFAWRLYDPAPPNNKKWLPSTYRLNDFGGYLKQMSFFIGIGHSF